VAKPCAVLFHILFEGRGTTIFSVSLALAQGAHLFLIWAVERGAVEEGVVETGRDLIENSIGD